MNGPIRNVSVYIVEDEALVRAGLRALVEQHEAYQVVGEQGDARAAIPELAALRPDIVILDITLPGMSGIDAIAPIKKASPHTKILIATHHQGSSFVEQALRAGADGYVPKNSRAEELGLAIVALLGGDSYVPARVAAQLVRRVRSDDPSLAPRLSSLTGREREVFQLIALGKANKEVASVLHVSLSTVKKHRENLQRKLDCHSGAEIARLAIREGLLAP